jgi:hypothetical protein
MRVNDALAALAARRASGILEIDGDPAGTVYFDQGQITCARASWTPDIGARLLGVLRPSADSLDLLTGASEPDRDIGTFLVQRNYLTIAELAAILRSVVVDTVIALTAFTDAGTFISAIRFTPAGAHWAAAFSCLEVDSVLAEANLRAERMARCRLGRATPVRLRDLSRPCAVLSRPQWALACAIDGVASAQDLAWRCGLALYQTIDNIGALIAAGLCRPDAFDEPASPPGPLAQWFGPITSSPTLPHRSAAPLDQPEAPSRRLAEAPRRRPATAPVPPPLSAPPALAAEAGRAHPGLEVTPPPPDLLRRVLEGLKRSG